jgi:ABC-type cobalamin/Fe3+-siderophores transport system ATPase subunit
MSIKRQSVFFIIVGLNGTGKTTLLHKYINSMDGRKLLVIDPDGMEWREIHTIEKEQVGYMKKGKAKIIAPDKEELETIMDFTDGTLVLDDCRYYLQSRMDEVVRKTLVRRRQNGVDVFAVAHGLSEVPAVFFTYATHLILFKTNDSAVRLRNTSDRERIKHLYAAKVRVNEHPDHHHYEVINLLDI